MERAGFLLRTRRIKSLFGTVSFALFTLLPYSFLTPVAAAVTATVTTLTVTPSNSLAAQQIVTLTASVQAGGQAVTVGTVSFYDGKLYLGSVQVVRSASKGYTVGTATYKGALRIGTHSLAATFLPTTTLATSSSAAQTVTVSGATPSSPLPAMLTLAGLPGTALDSTVLTATLSAYGETKPTGSVAFLNQTANSTLGTFPVNSANFTTGFSLSLTTPANGASGIFSVDLNGDGRPDILANEVAATSGLILQAYINEGNSSFKTSGPFFLPQPASDDEQILVSDFNGDGVPDIAYVATVNGSLELTVALGAGVGTFPTSEEIFSSAQMGDIAVGDFNGDGIPDLMAFDDTTYPSTTYIFLGKGDGTFNTSTPLTSTVLAGATSFAVQDFNQDGVADLAITTEAPSVEILLGNGDGTFQSPVSYPAEADGRDPIIEGTVQSRGNGLTDLLLNDYSTLGILLGNRDGTFAPEVTYPDGVNPPDQGQIVAADVTGDGLQDIAVLYFNPLTTSTTGVFTVYAGNGDGTYQPAVQYNFLPDSTPTGMFSLAAADFNGDGIADIGVIDGSSTYIFSSSFEGSAYYGENIPLTTFVYGSGIQQVVATYSGDSNYSSSTSNTITATGASTPAIMLGSSASSLQIAAGSTGTATLTVTPQNGYSGTVQFSCSGLPVNSTCSFSPSTVTPTGNIAATTTLTVATNVQVVANDVLSRPLSKAVLSLAFLMGFGFLAGNKRANRRLRQLSKAGSLCLMLLLGITLVVGCGGGNTSASGPSSPVTSAGTSTVTVKAVDSTSTSVSATTVLTITITN